MSYKFGDFELDENAGSLTLRGAIEDVQPRVLELLCYLVKNAGRVVPKEELLDQVWPGVIVTESSLQRAASLARKTLADGGLGHAIQNFPKRGYRFALDESSLGKLAPASRADDPLADAERAALSRNWEEASARFAAVEVTTALDADDLELWALCDECRGRPVEAIPALTRAVELHLAAGRNDRAGRAAVTLAKVELERSASARAQGWIERAREMLAGVHDDAIQAYLLWMRSRLATFAGRAEDALELASRAAECAERSGDKGLRALTLSYQGFYELSLGRVDEGSRLQNHAAAIALSSTDVDPITGSLIYCNILWSCRTYADWERALQWSDGFEEWCRASFAENPGACDLHRAEILGATGTLTEAFEKITIALPKLSIEEAWAIGEGYRVRGDISSMLGNLENARADSEMAYSLGWDAEPGSAVLLSERGEHDAALAALDRALEGRSWFHLQRRGVLLANAGRIAARAGNVRRAESYLGQLAADQVRWSQPTIRALMAEARADLAPAGDRTALQLRLLARQLWTSARIDYHAARVRLELAQGYLSMGDAPGAEAELAAADRLARRIASPRLISACEAIRRDMAPGHSPVPARDTGKHLIRAR